MDKLRENAEKELKLIEEKGLTSSNLDNAYKLTEIIKGIDKIDMMKGEGDYSNRRGRYSRDREDYSRDVMSNDGYARDGYGNSRDGHSMDSYDDGNSYRRGRSARTGRYVSRDSGMSNLAGEDGKIQHYHNMKHEYSQSRDSGSREKMLDALEDAVYSVKDWIMQACKDADCREERQILMKPVEEMYFYLKDMQR